MLRRLLLACVLQQLCVGQHVVPMALRWPLPRWEVDPRATLPSFPSCLEQRLMREACKRAAILAIFASINNRSTTEEQETHNEP